jgi:mono/diheme cytochrome c family protein
MKTFKKLIFTSVLILAVIGLANAQKAKPWDAPAKYKAMKNAVKADDASIKTGKDLFNKNCASCHGKTGLGDGPKAKGLDTFPGNFSEASFQSQTDGDLFFKVKVGRDEMPKYDGKLDDESIWSMVNYMKTLKK